ncbi:MAG: glycosyltransferase family 4 protein [Anaerolineaceae bacterium]
MKILIITNAFPPLNSIASLRPYSWAKYWSEVGHEICVLTTEKTSSSGWLDLKMDPEVAARIRVVPVPFFVFRNKTLNKTETGMLSAKTGGRFQFARQVVRWLRKNVFGSFLDSRMFWIKPAVCKALEIYATWKFDLIISTYDPPAAHIIASQLHWRLGVPWTADYRDLWSGSHIEKPVFPLDRIEKSLEERTMKGAFLLSTVSDNLRDQLKTRFHQPVVTVENGYDEDDFRRIETTFEFPLDGCVRILYTGKINKGKQDPTPLFQALAALQRQEKISPGQLEVLFFGQWLEQLPEMIAKSGLWDYVKVMGFMERETILRMQKAADLLLFLEFNWPGVDGILTGKLFEYMAAGRPILGIGMEESKATARLIHEAGIGTTFNRDPEPIAEFIESFLNGKAAPYYPNPKVIQRYSRRKLAKKLLHEITDNLI